jgi:hypothetical protein
MYDVPNALSALLPADSPSVASEAANGRERQEQLRTYQPSLGSPCKARVLGGGASWPTKPGSSRLHTRPEDSNSAGERHVGTQTHGAVTHGSDTSLLQGFHEAVFRSHSGAYLRLRVCGQISRPAAEAWQMPGSPMRSNASQTYRSRRSARYGSNGCRPSPFVPPRTASRRQVPTSAGEI